MAISPRGTRTTRLSSGSVQKRSYADDSTESSEDDDVIPSRSAGKGKAKQSKAVLAEAKRARKEEKAKRKKYADSEEDSASDFVDEDASESSDAGAIDEAASSEESYASDSDNAGGSAKKRKALSQKAKVKSASSAAAMSSPASVKTRKIQAGDSDGEVTQIVRAPSGPSPSDRISEHTLRFMLDLQDPLKNDRDWFAVHKNIYDWIHANWLNFTETCVDVMIDRVDDTIAWMKPKDLVERIYRDVRFSNDETPYKRHLSWCMSRNGKKGNYAKYYFSLSGNDRSGIFAGVYETSKEDLDTIRGHILGNSAQGRALRTLVKDAQFIKCFGAPPKPGKETKRTSLWGSDDELKRAPKGYEPDHPDVQWLRLKSYTVGHRFDDDEVTTSDFLDKLVDVGRQAARLVDVMNEMLHGAPPLAPANGP